MEKIIGVRKSEGEFNNIHYVNWLLYSQMPEVEGKIYGVCSKAYTMKGDSMSKMLISYGLVAPEQLIGLIIDNPFDDVYYDQTGKKVKNIKFKQ